MKKIIILLLCCGMLIGMVGCGGDTSPPPTESAPITASETIITETPTEITPPVTAVEPTEKEKVPLPTESKDQAFEPTTTTSKPTATTKSTEKTKSTEETRSTETAKPTEPLAAEPPKENGCITIVKTDDPPTEEIIIPPKPSADIVAQKVAEYINQFRTEQGDVTATVIPGLTEYCYYRCTQLKTNFAHDTTDQRAAAEALQYITGDEINDYYIRIRNDGLKGTTAQRHHALLHLAFKSAVKRRIIPSNPVEQADRPKAQQYIGKYYNAGELKELLDKTVDDPIHIVIFLAAYYGLRRSEVLGLKWSAVDFENKTVSISHKVVQNDKGVVGMDVMKTKSSYRTLPLIPQVEQALLAEREKQEEMKRVMRRGYCKKYTDYICVDAIGEIIKPNYVTDHFKVVLKENGLKPVRFHDLRHSCASLLLANGVPMKMIQDWLGHSDMGTTANIYSHIDSESKKASAMAIGTALA